MAKVTIGTQIRKALQIKSANGKDAWSEDGRGRYYGQAGVEGVAGVLEDLGLERGQDGIWTCCEATVEVNSKFVSISYLMMDRSWCEEKGLMR